MLLFLTDLLPCGVYGLRGSQASEIHAILLAWTVLIAPGGEALADLITLAI
jgi:hypothetical protein